MWQALIGPVTSIIDKLIPDPQEKARAKLKLFEMQQAGELTELEQQASIIRAEAQGESWLQRNWRPLLMVTFGIIVANNYLLAPYLQAMFGVGIVLDMPERLWDLLTLGVGGYVAGRSAEKVVKNLKKS